MTIISPFEALVAAVARDRAARAAASHQSGERERADRTDRKLVLIVEDDRDIRELLEETLEGADYAVQTATNGSEALDIIRREDDLAKYVTEGSRERLPSLILLDWMLPVLNGFGFYAALQAHHRLKSIPVVVMTAYAQDAEAKLPSWVLVLRKPLDVNALLETVAREAA